MSLKKISLVGALTHLALLFSCSFIQAQSFHFGVSATPNPVTVSNTLTYTIYVTNINSLPLPNLLNVYVTNRFSTNVVFALQSSTIGETAITNDTEIIFPIPSFPASYVEQLSFTLIPITTGALANQITALSTNEPTTISSNNFVTQVSAPTADLAIIMTNAASGVFAGGTTTIGLTVTNRGPETATGIVVANTLPTSFQLLSVTPANANTNFANGILTWTIGSLTNGEVAQLLASVRPTTNDTFSLTATVAASTIDPIATNNAVTNSMIVDAVVSTNLIVLTPIPPQQFNPQTGLMEHVVTVRNDGTNTVPAARLFVIGLGTNRLYNAAGTNNIGTNSNIPYVQHNAELAVGAEVPMRLEYYVRSRTPLTNLTYLAAGVTFTPPGTPTSSSPIITSVQLTAGGFMIEFQSIPGRSYTILYADNMSFTNALAAQPAVVAPADRVQWIDNGPPKTISTPANASSRFYRVLLNP